MAEGKPGETLISFKSGHYKKVRGTWIGDSVWGHFQKENGGLVHVNKEEVEYMETFGSGDDGAKKEARPLPGYEAPIVNLTCPHCSKSISIVQGGK